MKHEEAHDLFVRRMSSATDKYKLALAHGRVGNYESCYELMLRATGEMSEAHNRVLVLKDTKQP